MPQPQGAGQASGSVTFNLGDTAVTFAWVTDQSAGGVQIAATPAGCDSCVWAQTVSGTAIPGGTKTDIQKDPTGKEYDAKKFPFTGGTETPGQLWDAPSRSASPAQLSFVSTMGISDGKALNVKGSLVWGFSKDPTGKVRFSGVRKATAAEQKSSLRMWSAKTGMGFTL